MVVCQWAGWCPLGLPPSWPPQPTPVAYSSFLCQWAALPALRGMPAALGSLMLHGVRAPQMPP